LIRHWGAPSGAATFIASDKSWGNNLRIISEDYDFHRKNPFQSLSFPNVFHRYRIAGDATAAGAEARANAKAPKSVINLFINISPEPLFLKQGDKGTPGKNREV